MEEFLDKQKERRNTSFYSQRNASFYSAASPRVPPPSTRYNRKQTRQMLLELERMQARTKEDDDELVFLDEIEEEMKVQVLLFHTT